MGILRYDCTDSQSVRVNVDSKDVKQESGKTETEEIDKNIFFDSSANKQDTVTDSFLSDNFDSELVVSSLC